MQAVDTLGRPLCSLRISLTDRYGGVAASLIPPSFPHHFQTIHGLSLSELSDCDKRRELLLSRLRFALLPTIDRDRMHTDKLGIV